MSLMSEIESMVQQHLVVYAVVTVLIGAGLATMGYRLWTLFLTLAGLVMGGFAGVMIGGLTNAAAAIPLMGLGGAAVGALLLAGVRPLGTFVVGGCGVWMIVDAVASSFGQFDHAASPTEALGLLAASILVGGFVVMLVDRPAIILTTAFAGGLGAVEGAMRFLAISGGGSFDALNPSHTPATLAAVAALGAISTAIQFASSRPRPRASGAAGAERSDGPTVSAGSRSPETGVEVQRLQRRIDQLEANATSEEQRKMAGEVVGLLCGVAGLLFIIWAISTGDAQEMLRGVIWWSLLGR